MRFKSISVLYAFTSLLLFSGCGGGGGSSDSPAEPGNNLSSLSISNGSLSPAFDKSITDYTDVVPAAVNQITLTPTAEDNSSSIEINGYPLLSGNASELISLNNSADTTISIKVSTEATGTSKTYTITVKKATVLVTGISLNKPVMNVYINKSSQLTPVFSPSNPDIKTVKWTSADTSIATVDDNGLVTGHTVGATTIKAISDDGGKQTVCDLHVIPLAIGSISTTENTTSLSYALNTGDTLSFNCTVDVGSTGMDFPTGVNDSGTAKITKNFWINQTEVTYKQWETVYNWATTDFGNGKRIDGGPLYTISRRGWRGCHDNSGIVSGYLSGHENDPVCAVTWRDVIVWCNAMTEYFNAYKSGGSALDCVYYSDNSYTTPLRTTSPQTNIDPTPGSIDKPYIKASTSGNTSMTNCIAKGFRLPTSNEWEFAARYRGSNSTNAVQYPAGSGRYWTKGDSASGADGSTTDSTLTDLVMNNSGTSIAVKSRQANQYGLYDMSGNAFEYCFDWEPIGTYSESFRIIRGYMGDPTVCRLAFIISMTNSVGSMIPPWDATSFEGFRLVRTK